MLERSERTGAMTQLTEIDDTPPVKLGRKRDHTRDAEIMDAALFVLAEEGYDGMTIDMVAARAKAGKATVYRRWASKEELVIDSVACMKQADLEPSSLPDTGTLRGDLLAMIKPRTIEESDRKLRVMTGLMSMLAKDSALAGAVNEAIIAPRIAVNRHLLERAIARGEISASIDVQMISQISQAMVTYRMILDRKPIDPDFLRSIVTGVILPAVGLSATDD
jgi:AcrR family transcriptional regulator